MVEKWLIDHSSWQYRCMGAGLQQNLGKIWGPKTWSEMTSTNTNQVFVDVSNSASKIAKNDKQRKATEKAKEQWRKSKYAGKEISQQTRKAYNRYDNGSCPDDVVEDVAISRLPKKVMDGFYATKVVITPQEANEIERETRDQHPASDSWERERRVRITASKAGKLAKMRTITSRTKKVEEML